jgi:hypothetical protein
MLETSEMDCVNITDLFLRLSEQFVIDQIVNQGNAVTRNVIFIVLWLDAVENVSRNVDVTVSRK